jgi:hypothetical protein
LLLNPEGVNLHSDSGFYALLIPRFYLFLNDEPAWLLLLEQILNRMKQACPSKHAYFLLPVLAVFWFHSTIAQPVIQTFTYTGIIQTFTVPSCVYTMSMDVRGAQGGGQNGVGGGLGAQMFGVFNVTPGQVFRILVGGQGIASPPVGTGGVSNGGGGGSFVTDINNAPYCIAGGGGGQAHSSAATFYALQAGTVALNGNPGQYINAGAGGVNGNGGAAGNTTGGIVFNAAGGGGLLTNGGSGGAAYGGTAFISGGNGGQTTGGFGGGGGSNSFIYGCGLSPHGGHGGGGYSGGGGGGSNCNGAGGGGGSFNSGSNQSNSSGVQTGNGLVSFTYAPGITVSVLPPVVCAGNSSTLSLTGALGYTWTNNGSNSNSIVVNPLVTTVYSVQINPPPPCTIQVIYATVTVNPLPTLSVNGGINCPAAAVTLTATGGNSYTVI